MSIEDVREYALGLPHVTEDMPFGDDTLVFRIAGKIFLLMSLDGDGYICVKCDPERAIELRERYSEIEPAYHMNKKHWNGIFCNSRLSRNIIQEEIRHSYEQVFKKLPAKTRAGLQSNT